MNCLVIRWLIDWLADWLIIDWLTGWLTDWLTGWLTDWLNLADPFLWCFKFWRPWYQSLLLETILSKFRSPPFLMFLQTHLNIMLFQWLSFKWLLLNPLPSSLPDFTTLSDRNHVLFLVAWYPKLLIILYIFGPNMRNVWYTCIKTLESEIRSVVREWQMDRHTNRHGGNNGDYL